MGLFGFRIRCCARMRPRAATTSADKLNHIRIASENWPVDTLFTYSRDSIEHW